MTQTNHNKNCDSKHQTNKKKKKRREVNLLNAQRFSKKRSKKIRDNEVPIDEEITYG